MTGVDPEPHGVFRTLAALLADGPRRHAIAVLDVDGLTELNAAHGRSAGEEVLDSLTRRLGGALRSGERAARWAGDQYVVLLPRTGRFAALRRTRRLLAAIGPPTVCAGVAASPADGVNNLELVEAAAVALRRAKRAGRGRVR